MVNQIENEFIHIVESAITFQGEMFSGQRVLLLRFKNCNRVKGVSRFAKDIEPCRFCDTFNKMNELEENKVSILDIQKIVDDNKCGVMITGGEPTYAKNFAETFKIIENIDSNIQIETNGFFLVELVESVSKLYKDNINRMNKIKYVFSPKIFSLLELGECIEISKKLSSNDNFYIKLVYQNTAYVTKFLEEISKLSMNNRIYIMPEGKTKEELLGNTQKVLDIANEYNFNFSSRLHILHNFV